MHIPPPQPIRPGARPRARALPADLEPGQPVIPPEPGPPPGPPPRPAVWRLLLRWLLSFIIFSATLKGCQYYGRQLNKPDDVYYGRQLSKPDDFDEIDEIRQRALQKLIRAARTPTPPPGD